MSDFSLSDGDNHEQSNQLAQPPSSTSESSNLENGMQLHSPRIPAHQVLSEHDDNEEPLDSSPISEDSLNDNDHGWKDNWTMEDYDWGPIVLLGPGPMWAFTDTTWPIERIRLKEDEFSLSLSTARLVNRSHKSW